MRRILFGSDFPNIPYGYAEAVHHLIDLPGVDDALAAQCSARQRREVVRTELSCWLASGLVEPSSADPVEPPIPVPDVPGGDAGARGLPRRSDLTSRQRVIVDASAVADIALRTGVASIVATSMVPTTLASIVQPSKSRTEHDHMRFYAELAAAQDPAVSFPAPTRPPRVSTRPANPVAEMIAHGRVENIRFDSGFTAVNPALREMCGGFRHNNVVRAQHWRHDDGPHPTLCVIHGFMGSPYLANGLFLSLPWFYRSGYDVLLYTLPFHGRRAERFSPFSGYGFFSHGYAGFSEAMAQAVHDFRSVIDYLESTGVDRIALTGISLGGFTSALLASVDDRIQAVVPNVPVVTPDRTVDEWFPANKLVALQRARGPDRSGADRSGGTVCLTAELPPTGAQGTTADHHRARRPAGSTAAGRNALGTLGSLCVPLVPGQPPTACEPAGLPTPDDPLPAGFHVRLTPGPAATAAARRAHPPPAAPTVDSAPPIPDGAGHAPASTGQRSSCVTAGPAVRIAAHTVNRGCVGDPVNSSAVQVSWAGRAPIPASAASSLSLTLTRYAAT